MAKSDQGCDLLVFSAHPDDAELCCGGLLLVARANGWKTGVVDLTRGESGTLGTPETRLSEAGRASDVLGLSVRRNLGLPDGRVRDTDANRKLIVETVRALKPQVLVGPPCEDHHPDHIATAELLQRSLFLCGVRKYAPGSPPWRPKALLQHFGSRCVAPQLVVDISDVFEQRMKAVRAYESQFGVDQPEDFPVRLASARFLKSIEATLAYYGSLIGVAYGEPFTSDVPLPVTDLVGLFSNEPWKDR